MTTLKAAHHLQFILKLYARIDGLRDEIKRLTALLEERN